jgi:DNA-binding CsgD family transcriptional regulator
VTSQLFTEHLQRLFADSCAEPSATLLIDLPRGCALGALASGDCEPDRCFVVTENPCADYWEDLWSYRPRLLAADVTADELGMLVRRACAGGPVRFTPGARARLTPAERALLRGLSRGASNKRLAALLGVSEHTVQNRLSRILEKLGADNRTQAALYYLGYWSGTGEGPLAAPSLRPAQR